MNDVKYLRYLDNFIQSLIFIIQSKICLHKCPFAFLTDLWITDINSEVVGETSCGINPAALVLQSINPTARTFLPSSSPTIPPKKNVL